MESQIFSIVLTLHIIAGTIGLITGTLAMLTTKTTKNHKKLGKVFFMAMIAIFITSIYLSIVKNNVFLLLVGFFSFYLSATGYRALFLKQLHIKPLQPTWVDNIINVVGLMAGIILLIFSAIIFTKKGNFYIVTAFFALVALRVSIADIQKFTKKPTEGFDWVKNHGLRMAGAYTATVTAFIVVSFQSSWIFWILPGFIIIPFTHTLIKKFKTKNMKKMKFSTRTSLATLTIIAITLLNSSCAYDKKFLAPRVYQANTSKVTVSATKNDSTIAVYQGSPFQPSFLKNGVDTIDLNYTIESVIFPSSTGALLNGWMMKHKTVPAKHTIINFHGNGGSILGQNTFILPMLAQGYQVFVFDYTGYGFSTGTAMRKHLPKDGISALQYVKNRTDCKNKKIILYGQSYGGHLAASVAHQATNLVNAVVIEGGFSNHKELGSNGAKPFIAFMSKIFIKEMYSGSKLIAKNKLPLLVIHSTEDETIPYKMGEKLFKNATSTKTFYTINGKHLMGTKLYGKEIAEKIELLLK